MPNLQKRLDVTELDFDSIKSNLITYFKGTESFKDWDYSGSGLNQLLDVLAYNTHYNAMLAHTAVNESFIDTAQLRSSVVSNAKLLGYLPHSKSSPTVKVNMSFGATNNSLDQNPNDYVILRRGSKFRTKYGDNLYIYTTLDDNTLRLNNDGQYVNQSDIEIREGSLQNKTFAVTNISDKLSYIINDNNIDLSTLIVRVYDNINSDVFEVYRNFTSLELTSEKDVANSAIYFISENAYGQYEISFSTGGVFGKKPPNLGVIVVEYLSTSGSESNGASIFEYVDALPRYTSNAIITTSNSIAADGSTIKEKSFGGNEKETIDSIRLNAPSSFVAQNRAVTANDYKSLIYSKFPQAKSITVWGGESNVPPQYGNVYISIEPKTNENSSETTLTPREKQEILNFLDSKKILSITPILVDPQKVFLILDVFCKYDNNISVLTKNQLENKIRGVIAKFNSDYLESFEKVFRHSILLRSIDTSDPAILNSLVRVFVSKNFKVEEKTLINSSSQPERIILDFGTPLTVLDNKTIVFSEGWIYQGNKVYLGDEASNNSNIRNVFKYTLEEGRISKFKDNKGVIVPPIGTINLEKGILEVTGLQADNANVSVRIDVIPLSNDIAPKRNQLLAIDINNINVTAEIDIIATGGSARTIDYKPFARER